MSSFFDKSFHDMFLDEPLPEDLFNEFPITSKKFDELEFPACSPIPTQSTPFPTSIEPLPLPKPPIIHNIVATIKLGVKINCRKVSQYAQNSKYNPKRFPAVILYLRNPMTTAFIFSTGSLTVLGARTVKKAKLASRKFARIIQKIGYRVKWNHRNFKIGNMLASCDLRYKVNLVSLSIEHSNFCSYEPELFSGVVYKLIDPKVTLLIFVSGKIVIMGKSEENINNAFKYIKEILKKHRAKSLFTKKKRRKKKG